MAGLDVTRKTSLTEDHVRVLEGRTESRQAKAAAKCRKPSTNTASVDFLVGPNMHDSLAVAAFLDRRFHEMAGVLRDVETTGELTRAKRSLQPHCRDLKRRPGTGERSTASMAIRGSAPTPRARRTSPVVRDKFVPNTKLGDVDRCGFSSC